MDALCCNRWTFFVTINLTFVSHRTSKAKVDGIPLLYNGGKCKFSALFQQKIIRHRNLNYIGSWPILPNTYLYLKVYIYVYLMIILIFNIRT